ncbi:hypothetical protein FUAX_05510 [Fulvitalea axinellae]|uniref:Leucine-binding protein domain-containing protein n=1 Tax=Fulvitalea axinellae TaxID=1182444 RepID=A0AAU9D103_9BACT|nr:hypothetical protein FUAX_05510 [Fulvitalea axinellae]
MKYFLILIMFLPAVVWGQDNQIRFEEGKTLLEGKRYKEAMATFLSLTETGNQNCYARYACFYYGYAAYEAGEKQKARAMFTQVTVRYPEWKQADDARVWLAQIAFDEGFRAKAMAILEKVEKGPKRKTAYEMARVYLDKSDTEDLRILHKRLPEDKTVAMVLAEKLAATQPEDREPGELEALVREFKLNPEMYGVKLKTTGHTKKSSYNVAVMLPFLYINDSASIEARTPNFVYNLYSGMELAQRHLAEEGVDIKLYPYDTKKSRDSLSVTLATDHIEEADLILGPLYSSLATEAVKFSDRSETVLFNPLSTDSALVADSEYAKLFLPDNETQARQAARFAVSKVENRNAMIFYGTKAKDSIKAYEYKRAIEKDSFNVAIIRRLDRYNARSIDKMLRAKTKVPTDSVNNYGVRIMEDSLHIAPDSIGHIYVASDNEILATSVIAGISGRPDTVMLIGDGRWLDYFVTPETLEEKEIYLVAPNFVDMSTDNFQRFREDYARATYRNPDRYASQGYDMLMLLGKMLKENGTEVLPAKGTGFVPGTLYYGYDFDEKGKNRVVPIIKYKDYTLRVANKPEEETED